MHLSTYWFSHSRYRVTCGNTRMFVGWVVTYQAASRVISRPKVWLSICPTSALAITSSYFCSEFHYTDHSQLYNTTDFKTADTNDSVSSATGRCIAHVRESMLRVVPLFLLSSLHTTVLAARSSVVFWLPGRVIGTMQQVGGAPVLAWLASTRFCISDFFTVCAVFPLYFLNDMLVPFATRWCIVRLSAIQLDFCNK
jgi:hypothetical protein